MLTSSTRGFVSLRTWPGKLFAKTRHRFYCSCHLAPSLKMREKTCTSSHACQTREDIDFGGWACSWMQFEMRSLAATQQYPSQQQDAVSMSPMLTSQIHKIESRKSNLTDSRMTANSRLNSTGEYTVTAARLMIHLGLPNGPILCPTPDQSCRVISCKSWDIDDDVLCQLYYN